MTPTIDEGKVMITLSVAGMTCNHCVHSVTKALQSVSGVESVNVNLEQGRAQIQGRPDAEALIQAVEQEGYEAKLLESQ